MEQIKAVAAKAREALGWLGAHTLLMLVALVGEDSPIRKHPVWTGACVLLLAGIVLIGITEGIMVVAYAVGIVGVLAYLSRLFVRASQGAGRDD